MLKLIPYALILPLAASALIIDKAGADAASPNDRDSKIIQEKSSKNSLMPSPEQTVDSLAAKSSDWQEPSRKSEEEYKQAIRSWLDQMPTPQRERTYEILHEAHPEIHALRIAIRNKKKELANLSFNRHTSPEMLPRLGQELQALRKILYSRLETINKRLQSEVGITMGPLEGDAFWLNPQDNDYLGPSPQKPARKKLNSLNLAPLLIISRRSGLFS